MSKIKNKLSISVLIFCIIILIKNVSFGISWVATADFTRNINQEVASCQHYWSPEVKTKNGRL